MRILDLTLKDLTQVIRDWKAAAFMVAIPIVFNVLIGFLFSGLGAEEDPRLPVGFVDRDASAVSAHLQTLLETSAVVRPVVLEGEDADAVGKKVCEQELAAAVIVPVGYGDGVFSDEPPRLAVIVDENTTAGSTARDGIQTAVTRLLGSVEAARLSGQAFEAGPGFAGEEARQEFLLQALDRAIEAWSEPPLVVTTTQPGAAETEEEIEVEEEAKGERSGFARASSGNIAQFIVMGVISSAQIILVERKSRSLQRLLTTAISRVEIILGHFLAIFTLSFLQLVLMIAFGDLVLNVGYMREPVAVLLMMVTASLWTGGMGLLIGVLSKSEEQVAMFSVISSLVMAGLGGAWVPFEFTSEAFQFIGHLVPTAWVVDGLQNIVLRGLGPESVLLPAGVLLAYAVGFFALAVWRFRFE